jgi:hypothetical protein
MPVTRKRSKSSGALTEREVKQQERDVMELSTRNAYGVDPLMARLAQHHVVVLPSKEEKPK